MKANIYFTQKLTWSVHSSIVFVHEHLMSLPTFPKRIVRLYTVVIAQISLVFVLKFNGPVNTIGSCRARSVYLTTLLLDRLSHLSG